MSGSAPVDTATIAFRRVLAESTAGEQARVDALVVLSQRTLYAATWPGPNQIARTLTNSDGETALPLFTGMDSLETTATRFGWRDPDGSIQFRELGAREALRHALARGVHFVVLDIGTDHSVEFAREELEPLLQLQSAGGSGPFAGTGEPHAAILDAVRRSTKPPTSGYIPEPSTGSSAAIGGYQRPQRLTPKRPVSHPLTGGAKPPSVKPPPVLSANDNRDSPLGLARGRTPIPGTMPSVSPGRTAARSGKRADGTAARHSPPTRDDLRPLKLLEPPKLLLSDALRLGISAALRAFPEVEWACVVSDESTIPVIGVRVDPSFLNRLAEITDAILGASDKQGIELQVLLLNNAELVKSAHKHGHAFYPWRK
ncbi:MAG TPA: SseB family protein [Polyangiales bacterium]|nr:SseB family protein [Polyangiales bacterium]